MHWFLKRVLHCSMIGVSSRRMNTRRLIGYLLLNALVSAIVTLSVLWFWDRTHTSPRENPFPILTPSGNNATALSPAGETTLVVPTTVPVPEPTATPTTYVVQSGDTLGVIAERYELAVEDLMAANGLTDPNALSVGQLLIIPVPGSPAASPTEPPPTNAPPLPTATPDPNQPPPQLTIREVRSPGVITNETVVLVNAGGPVNLAGWVIRDATGRHYTFPALTLFTGGAVNLHTGAGADTVTDLYWNQTEAVWTTGTVAQALDTSGTVQARFTVP